MNIQTHILKKQIKSKEFCNFLEGKLNEKAKKLISNIRKAVIKTFIRTPKAYISDFSKEDGINLVQDVSAVTAACCLIKTSTYKELLGFDEKLAVAFNDVDLCMKFRELGYLNIFTPFAEMYHYESKTRGLEEGEKLRRFEREVAAFRAKWKTHLDAGDPYYNPNFSLDRSDFSLKIQG